MTSCVIAQVFNPRIAELIQALLAEPASPHMHVIIDEPLIGADHGVDMRKAAILDPNTRNRQDMRLGTLRDPQ